MQTDLRRHALLIDELESLFPLVNPSLSDSLDVIRYRAGQRSVVEHLKNELKYQEEQASELNTEVLGVPNV